MRQACVYAMFGLCLLGLVGLTFAQQDVVKDRLPGAALTIGATTTATVQAIDPYKRVVTLRTEDGKELLIPLGKEVRNFDQIKVGDTVKAAAIARMVVAVGKDRAPEAEAATFIARSPVGAKPGVLIARAEEVSAKIEAVDPAKHTVTVQGLAPLAQTVPVAPDVDLSAIKVGDELTLRVTKGFALWIPRPAEGQPSLGTPTAEPSAFLLEGATKTAIVESIDSPKRLVTLKTDDGIVRTIHLGKACVNFDQIRVGDKVRATLVDSIAIAIGKGGVAPKAEAEAVMIRPPVGEKPGLLIADVEELTGQIKSIDVAKGTFVLARPDGLARTIRVGPEVKIGELKAGEDITVRATQALAILVEKP